MGFTPRAKSRNYLLTKEQYDLHKNEIPEGSLITIVDLGVPYPTPFDLSKFIYLDNNGHLTYKAFEASMVPDMATMTWVNGQGFVKTNAISDMATKTWVNQQNFIKNTVDNLTNYYTKTQVEGLISSIEKLTLVVASTLPTASASTMNKIYLIPSSSQKEGNVKDEYITIQSGSNYSWEQIGSTAIDTSNFALLDQVNNFSQRPKVNNKNIALSEEIPTALSSFTDDLGSSPTHTHSQYLTEHQSLANYVLTTDSRLSDARTPTAHTHDDRYYTEAEVNSLLSNYLNTASPESTGLFYHKGFGAGHTDVVFKLQSNNAVLSAYGDASSILHLTNCQIAMDSLLHINAGIQFTTYGQSLNFNAASLSQIAAIDVNASATGRVSVNVDYNGYPQTENQAFVVKMSNLNGGYNDNWSYQAYAYNSTTATYSRNFGVKSDGTIYSKGVQVATINDIPTIPTVNNSTITIQLNGATVDSFTTNQSSAKTINISGVAKTGSSNTFTGTNIFNGLVDASPTGNGVQLGTDVNSNSNISIVSNGFAQYIDFGKPNGDYNFRMIKWYDGYYDQLFQMVYGGNDGNYTISVPKQTGTIAMKSDIPDVSGKLDKSGGTMTGDLFYKAMGNNPSSGAIDGGFYFFNSNSAVTSSYCYGLYQWGDVFQFTARTNNGSSGGAWRATAFEIAGSTGVVDFKARPTVNNTNVALSSELPSISFWKGTQAQYDAISSKDANTLYIITE